MGSRQEGSGWPKRRTPRLQGYDYSQAGAYAVTICTHGGAFLFGRVRDSRMVLSGAGRVVEAVWDGLPAYYGHVTLDVFVVMPDHVHGVIMLADVPLPADEGWESDGGQPAAEDALTGRPEGRGSARTKKEVRRHGLSEVVRGFKSMSGQRVNALRETPGMAVWQRGFYEHVVRSEADLNRIRQYIAENPARWWLTRGGEARGRGGSEPGSGRLG